MPERERFASVLKAHDVIALAWGAMIGWSWIVFAGYWVQTAGSVGAALAFVGGGAVALAEQIRDWFPNQAIAEHPAFANARGMLKYLRYVCEASNAG